jgi:hypothetical protein
MAPRQPNIKIPIGDLAKIIAKVLSKDATKTTKAGRELTRIASRGIGAGKSKFPKQVVQALPKPTRPLVPKPPRPKGVGKIANVKPERKFKDYVPKGATLPKTSSVQRGAEKSGNRRIAISEGGKPPKKAQTPLLGGGDTRGSIVVPPTKATLRPAKPSKGYYEADMMRGQKGDDAARMGGGQKAPKKRKPPASGAAAKKPASPKRPSGGAGAAKPKPKGPKEPRGSKAKKGDAFPPMTTKQKRTLKLQSDVDKIQDRIANAKTPKQKRNAELLLRNRILEAASKSRSGYGQYSGTRPLSER